MAFYSCLTCLSHLEQTGCAGEEDQLWKTCPASSKRLSRKWTFFSVWQWIAMPTAHTAGGGHTSLFLPDLSFSMMLTSMAIPVGVAHPFSCCSFID